MKKLFIIMSAFICLIISPLNVSAESADSSSSGEEEIVIISEEEENRHDLIIWAVVGILVMSAGTGTYVFIKKKDNLSSLINAKNSTD